MKYPSIGDVRGLGAMMAMEFVKNNDPLQPDAELCQQVMEGCGENGLIIRKTNPELEEFPNLWWNLLVLGSHRDQLSMPFD